MCANAKQRERQPRIGRSNGIEQRSNAKQRRPRLVERSSKLLLYPVSPKS
jgi:hypothetical protein